MPSLTRQLVRLLGTGVLVLSHLIAQPPPVLPGTARWDFPADIIKEQHDELLQYFEARIDDAARRRGKFWQGAASVESNRAEFRRLIGAVDKFLDPVPQRKQLAETPAFTFSLVQWPVLRLGNSPATSGPAVTEYGLLLESKRPGKHPAVVAIPDAHLSAGDIAGLSQRIPQREQYARSLAVNGYIVFVPFFTQRRTFSQPWAEDRDWLVRLGYQVGRHLIGAEVQQVSSAIDFLSELDKVDTARIGVVGSGQGGLTALYAAALDPRIKATLVANYFNQRERAYEEPEDRIIWKHMERFGDAEVAAMVTPRALVIDRGGENVKPEFERAQQYFRKADAPNAIRYIGERDQQHGPSTAAIERFDEVLHPDVQWMISPPQPPYDPELFYSVSNAQFSQWQARFRNLALEAYAYRDQTWQRTKSNFEMWKRQAYERYLDTTGRYPAPTGPLDARTIKVYDEPDVTGYRVSVRLYDGVHAYGILLIPKNLKPGEKRAAVITQHGFSGKPEHALGVEDDARADSVYSKFGRTLAHRGYVVFAPLISVETTERRNALVRRAHLIGLTPVGIEIKKASRIVDFLETLDFVDEQRIGYYGLSYGGYMALWTGPAEPRLKVVISSGHFNDWNMKMVDPTQGTSFLFHKDTFDMNNFDILHNFNHSDLAALTAPRAFMVEIGSRDGVVIDPRRFVDIELARVTDLYRQLGIPNKGRVARFAGPHKIDGAEAYSFLDVILK
ncbi:MAG: acetylxylan esterase [Bryobacterales bacterium]|nr:acetylxylan esterase [Bryobacterales bacterium]